MGQGSIRDEWETPQWLIKQLKEEFPFQMDVCATTKNKKCGAYHAIGITDGLQTSWAKYSYCNPPFSESAKWIKKAYKESLKGCTVVMLLMVATSTVVWHEVIAKAEQNYEAEIRFLKGRLKYEIDGIPAKNSPFFDSAIVIFGKNRSGRIFAKYKKGCEPEFY